MVKEKTIQKDNIFLELITNFTMELIIAIFVAMIINLSCVINRTKGDLTVNFSLMFALTLQTRLFVAYYIKNIYLNIDYLYIQLGFAILTVISSIIGMYSPLLSSIINGILPILIAYVNTVSIKEEEYYEWIEMIKNTTVIDNKVIQYCELE